MAPLTCIGPKGGNQSEWNCVIRIGNSYGIPFFTHYGQSQTYPTPCACPTESSACDTFDFLSGMMVYDVTKNATAYSHMGYSQAFAAFLPVLEVFYMPPPFSAAACSQLTYFPSFASLSTQSQANITASVNATNNKLRSRSWRQQHYNFSTTLSYGTGSLITWRSSSPTDQSVSPYFFQLANGGCADVAYWPSAFERLQNVSWGNLEEDYYRCTQTAVNAVFTSLGVSAGTAASIAPIFAIFVIYATMTAISISRKPDQGGGFAHKGEGGEDEAAFSSAISIDDPHNSSFTEELELTPLSDSKVAAKSSSERPKRKAKKKRPRAEAEDSNPPPPEEAGCVPGIF